MGNTKVQTTEDLSTSVMKLSERELLEIVPNIPFYSMTVKAEDAIFIPQGWVTVEKRPMEP